MPKDILVIGGGPGGYAAAIYSAKFGHKVTLVEKADIGGTCLNRGCIPTKALLHAADQLREIAATSDIGIKTGEVEVDFSQIAKFKEKTVRQLRGGVEFLLKKNKVEMLRGTATMLDAKRVEVRQAEGETLVRKPDAIVLAMGSHEIILPGFEPDGIAILNSTQMLELAELPESMIIIGGGVIGVEFASVLAGFGKKVSIVEYMPRLLPDSDEDTSDTLRYSFDAQSIEILTGSQAKNVVSKDQEGITILVDQEGVERELSAQKLLVCVGRRANLTDIGLEAARIKHNEKFVETGIDMSTSVSGVYAVGDITASAQLAHVAYHEAFVAAKAISGKDAYADYTATPACIYSHPEIASVGLSEQTAREMMPVEVETQSFAGNGKAIIEQQSDGFVKMVYNKDTGRLVGCQIIGPKATELICEPTLAIRNGLTVGDIADTIHAHPSLGELLVETAEAAIGHGLHSL